MADETRSTEEFKLDSLRELRNNTRTLLELSALPNDGGFDSPHWLPVLVQRVWDEAFVADLSDPNVGLALPTQAENRAKNKAKKIKRGK